MRRLLLAVALLAAYSAPSWGVALTRAQHRLATSVTQYGICWQFSDTVRVGNFITGDYYVLTPATVFDVTPPQTTGRNGSWLNPTTQWHNPWDSRIDDAYPALFTAAYRPTYPLALTAGDALVSTASHREDPDGNWFYNLRLVVDYAHTSIVRQNMEYWDNTNPATSGWDYSSGWSNTKTMAVLTCLATPPPTDAFRPPMMGPDSIFTASLLNRALLPTLALPDTNVPAVNSVIEAFRKPWLDNDQAPWLVDFLSPTEHQPDYGGQYAYVTGVAGLLLCSDLPADEKEPLLLEFTQTGIDLWGKAIASAGAGASAGWKALGGHGNGRKLPILMAGLLLGRPVVYNVSTIFSEDQQTVDTVANWLGQTTSFRRAISGTSEHDTLCNYMLKRPGKWGYITGENYNRTACSPRFPSTMICILAMDGLKTAWNHDAYLRWTDNWMTCNDDSIRAIIHTELDSAKAAGQTWAVYDHTNWDPSATIGTKRTHDCFQWGKFTRQMWDLHRGSYSY